MEGRGELLTRSACGIREASENGCGDRPRGLGRMQLTVRAHKERCALVGIDVAVASVAVEDCKAGSTG